MLELIKNHLYNIVVALVILLVGFTLGLIVSRVLRKTLHKLELDKIVEKLGKNYHLEKNISRLMAYLIYFTSIILFLNQLGITSIVLYVILGVVLLLLGAAFLIGIKDFIPNLIAGLLIYKRTDYKEGKKIKFEGVQGKIEKIGLLEIEVKTKEGDRIHIPNSLLVKSKVWLN